MLNNVTIAPHNTRVKKVNMRVILHPTESVLDKHDELLGAVHRLISYNCFCGDNPMRKNPADPIVWEWAIVKVGNFAIPAPYHTLDDDTSFLFTVNGDEVHMNHKEFAYTTASFYLERLYQWAQQHNVLASGLPQSVNADMSAGSKAVRKLSQTEYLFIQRMLKSQLTEKGFQILN